MVLYDDTTGAVKMDAMLVQNNSLYDYLWLHESLILTNS